VAPLEKNWNILSIPLYVSAILFHRQVYVTQYDKPQNTCVAQFVILRKLRLMTAKKKHS
jgi:hypothetical protein